VVPVDSLEQGVPDFYIYEYDELADIVSKNHKKYLAAPKRDGSSRRDVGFRWCDESMFAGQDRQRKNNWQAIEEFLR
jgi:hypothetical protein